MPSHLPPLAVDLDGTLLRTDLLYESVRVLFRRKPWIIPLLPLWLLRGRAYLKLKIFERVRPDCAALPLHEELLAWLRTQKATGRRMVLATGSHRPLAELAVAHLELFDDVIGSDGAHNVTGRAKVAAIVELCGPVFDYAGNSREDLPVWRASREAVLVHTRWYVAAIAHRTATVTRIFR